MAADSANIALIDIFRLLVRSGVITALLSTQTPAASDHSLNHEPPATINASKRWPFRRWRGRQLKYRPIRGRDITTVVSDKAATRERSFPRRRVGRLRDPRLA